MWHSTPRSRIGLLKIKKQLGRVRFSDIARKEKQNLFDVMLLYSALNLLL